MKKTISINISGLVFNIEEEAYNVLSNYLEEIRGILAQQEGVDEILEDIESRIAELFNERLHDHKAVITYDDVADIIQIMGSPKQYKLDDDSNTSFNEESTESMGASTSHQKRFYRDEDDAVIGGVASGLGHYFGIDPVIIRVIFVLMFVLGGSGILLYLILWIVIPAAESTAQKLQMRGEPVNVDSIKNYVHNIKDEAKSGVSNASKSVRSAAKRGSSALARIIAILGRIIGFGMMVFGLIFFVVVILIHFGNLGSFLSLQGDISNNFYSLTGLIFPEGSEQLGFWSLFFAIILPVIAITVIGIKLLFQITRKSKILSIVGLVFWIISISILAFVGVETGLDFKTDYVLKEKVEQQLAQESDTLQVEFTDPLWDEDYLNFKYNDYLSIDQDSIAVGFPMITFQRDLSIEVFEVDVLKRSNGASLKQARTFAENIRYNSSLAGNKLILPAKYTFPTENKIRGQFASLVVRVPEGKRIILPGDMDDFPVRFEDCDHFSDDFLEEPSVWEATKDGMEFVGLFRVNGKKLEQVSQDDE